MPSDRTQARKAVLASIAVLAFFSFYRGQKDEGSVSSFRRLWGTAVVGVFLSLLADFAPSIAAPLAVLVVLGSFSSGGDKALQNLLGKVSTGGVGNARK